MKYKLNLARCFISLERNMILFLLGVGVPFLALSATTVTVSVTVLAAPSCVVNGNRIIETEFGEILTVNVDGTQHMKSVDYTLECSSLQTNAIQMKVQGNATSFDASALQTNIGDFGVALRANGQPLGINSWLKFTYPDKPLLQAVPVKKAGKKLSGGSFSAGATLLVAYQ